MGGRHHGQRRGGTIQGQGQGRGNGEVKKFITVTTATTATTINHGHNPRHGHPLQIRTRQLLLHQPRHCDHGLTHPLQIM